MKELSVKELAELLSVSEATVKNWLKCGKIVSQSGYENKPYFSGNYAENLLKNIKNNDNKTLKSRRNKTYIKGNSLYNNYVSPNSKNLQSVEKILKFLEKNTGKNDEIIKYFLAECTIQFIVSRKKINAGTDGNFLKNYLENKIDLGFYSPLADFFISGRSTAISTLSGIDFSEFNFTYEENEDILGLLYISCSNIGRRKQHGTYYTPTNVVKGLIARLPFDKIQKNTKILDCCCGTGNFLINLPENICLEQIYGNDLDPVGSHITKINLALKYEISNLDTINKNITNLNFLTEFSEKNFDFIIGNPPWGYRFTETEKQNLKQNFQTAQSKNIESYDIFTEKSLSILKKGGILSFVLPEAVLNVKTHSEIREIIKCGNSIRYVRYLGNIFDKVHCPAVILQLEHNEKPFAACGAVVQTKNGGFIIHTERNFDEGGFNLKITDDEYKILQKLTALQGKIYLKNNADFALGIVTGNNEKCLSHTKTKTKEVIIKGTDISPYGIKPPNTYIEFIPADFQQTAPENLYRISEKLLYKFVSSKLVFAYDNEKRLTLNSCNILIPKFKNYDIKYILAILNSKIAQFIFKNKFNSVKVLRSHLEQIPIPVCTQKKQAEIIGLADILIANFDPKIYARIEKITMELYKITSNEYKIIQKNISSG